MAKTELTADQLTQAIETLSADPKSRKVLRDHFDKMDAVGSPPKPKAMDLAKFLPDNTAKQAAAIVMPGMTKPAT